MAALQPEAFLDCFLRWPQSLRQTMAQEIVALDGKALRRALRRGQAPRYIVSAWAQGNGLVLGQFKVAEKSNEITALPQLLRVVERVRQVGTEEPTVERRYYLSSRAVDVQMGEDPSRARTGHAAENLATLRRLALNLLKRDKTKKRGLKGKQLNAGWDHAHLLRLLAS